ncbi:hypothetical protein [Streptomyces sp. CBMA123]|uniref:hypothetical protein n=1 Tax=Streptomyces sp. CBMA123 TaxID=1896313 RepID=UPI001662123E|nr:hypothetical protein [Streptomyces sp. CBMA123]MBD0690790.1 hypothetical protein [Streptomyces sp. CBMA123]
MIGIIVLAVVGLVLLFPVVMTRLAKRKLAQLERAKATIADHEARLAAEARAKNTIVPADHGLVPGSELVPDDEPGPEEAAALAAAKAGDWRPAAAYLSADATADLRWRRQRELARLAAEDDGWLRDWRAEHPQDPTAALLHADALVYLAWNIRTSARANQVTREQFESFRRVLLEAEQAAVAAAALAPDDDPSPWVVQTSIAMGLNWPNDRFRGLWAELVKRDPHHWSAHARALQYWCDKWHGSHELMHGFIDEAIAAAPAGSLLTPFKLEAYWEQFAQDREKLTAWERPEVGAALDTALADLAAADPGHPRIRYARGWLAYALTRAGRPTEALEQFQALGHFLPQPFTNFNDPRQAFIDLRIAAVQGAVAQARTKA